MTPELVTLVDQLARHAEQSGEVTAHVVHQRFAQLEAREGTVHALAVAKLLHADLLEQDRTNAALTNQEANA